jgi:putative ABC transport system permease protein
VVFLTSYLVFFLTGLAYGLAFANRTSVDSWQADGIVLSTSANKNLMGSSINGDTADRIAAQEKANLVAMNAVILKYGVDDDAHKVDTIFFGTDYDSFIFSEVTEGRMIENDNEVVADQTIKTKEGLNIGDKIKVVTNNQEYTIVGFVNNSQFNTQPVIFTSITNAGQLKASSNNVASTNIVNGVVVRNLDTFQDLPEGLEYLTSNEFIQNLPGYQAQVLTFGLMIGMLILISALVIGIFMYILTIQKQKVFGIMKAQGIPGGVISKSVLAQTTLLASLGVGLGLLVTYLTSLGLPAAVPYINNWSYFCSIGLLMAVTSVFGSLLSVRAVSKIDPLEAMG